MENNITKNTFIVCLYWLASLSAVGNFAYAQTELEVPAPVEILMADPEIVGSSVALTLFEQAKKHHDGDSVAQDFSKARELYLRAAQMGSNDAKVNLGYLYFMGEGVVQSYSEAHKWYLSAAKNGNKDAQLNLAMIYQNGFGVDKDNNKAKYWRTYEQVQPINKRTVVTVSKKPTVEKQIVRSKPVVSKIIESQDSARDAKQLVVAKPKTIIDQINANKKKIEVKPTVVKDPVITIAQATQTIPKSQIPSPLAEEQKLGMGSVSSANHQKMADSVPQAQLLTTQAKDGQSGIGDTIAVLNKEAIIPAPIRTLRNRSRLEDKSPQILSLWISSAIAAIMLALVIFTSIWFFVQYAKIGKQKKAHVFARAFYAHHRDRLRINYLHYPEKHRKIEEIDDSWAAVLCVLMVKFAQSQQEEETLVGMQSNKIMQALKESPFKAKEAVFPFVKITQRRIFDDIEAHECNYNGETKDVDETLMTELMQTPKNDQFTEVKLQSDSCEKQASLFKESNSSDITE